MLVHWKNTLPLIDVRPKKGAIKLLMPPSAIHSVPESHKTQGMFDSVTDQLRHKISVIKLVLKILSCQNIVSIDTRPKKCVIKLLMLFYQH